MTDLERHYTLKQATTLRPVQAGALFSYALRNSTRRDQPRGFADGVLAVVVVTHRRRRAGVPGELLRALNVAIRRLGACDPAPLDPNSIAVPPALRAARFSTWRSGASIFDEPVVALPRGLDLSA